MNPSAKGVLQGFWFDGVTAAGTPAQLLADTSAEIRITAATGALLHQGPFNAVRVSARIGNTPRSLYFAQGEKFETADNAEVDALLEQFRPDFFNSLIHRLESHLGFVILTLAVVISLTWAGVKYGLPAASRMIAFHLPPDVMARAAQETLLFLDKAHFKPSQLDTQVQNRVLQHFAPAVEEYQALNVRIEFRDGGDLGANAFALPNGVIIFTDQMVNLAQDDRELLAVLAHEIGHVKFRHALRASIQSASLGFLVSMVTGDLNTVSSLLTALPIMLTSLAFSRDFENEADDQALAFLDNHQIPRQVFANLMQRLVYEHQCNSLIALEAAKSKQPENATEQAPWADAKKTEPQSPNSQPQNAVSREALQERHTRCDALIAAHQADKNPIVNYFSTHPATEERLQKFR